MPITPRAIIGRAAMILPEPPATVEMLAETGGAMRIQLLSRTALEYRARVPRLRVGQHAVLRARVDAIEGGGHDVEMRVVGMQVEDQWTAVARLEVTAIHPRSAQRATTRVRIAERAPVYAMSCRAIRSGEQFEVEMTDLSVSGLAFASDRAFSIGDLLALMPQVDGQPMRLRARVLRTDAIDEGLMRVGCEIAAVTAANRLRIARVAADAADPTPAA
jgi:PilZ domain